MSIVEQIINLKIDLSDKDEQYQKFEEALKDYHSLIDAGIIKARENNIQQVYNPLEFAFNSNPDNNYNR